MFQPFNDTNLTFEDILGMENEITDKLAYLSEKNDIISEVILNHESFLEEEDNKVNINMMDEIYKSTASINEKFENCKYLYNDLVDSPIEQIKDALDRLIKVVNDFETNLNELIQVKQNIKNILSGEFNEHDTD